MLSKNFTGVIITFLMVVAALVCCTIAKSIQKNLMSSRKQEVQGIPQYPYESDLANTDDEDDDLDIGGANSRTEFNTSC